MSSAVANTFDDEFEFSEMKPLAIYHMTPEEYQASIPLDIAALPESSATERAFIQPLADYNEDTSAIDVRKVKAEPKDTDSICTDAATVVSFDNESSTVGSIHLGAVFSSFAEFSAAFESWKESGHHPMRIASSEALKDPVGKVDEKFRYKHAVYHCAHYGKPRVRGSGVRPNQNYMACGCPAMFRVNFNYADQVLRVTSMNIDHTGHSVTYENYKAVCSNIRTAKRSHPVEKSSTPSSSSTVSPINSDPETTVVEQKDQNLDLDNLSLAALKEYCRKLEETDGEQWTPKAKRVRRESKQPSTSRCTPTRNRNEASEVSNERSSRSATVRTPNVAEVVNEEYPEDTVIDVPGLPGLPKMEKGAAFKNWNDFEASFENWKSVGMHPMRVASSETMKDLNGQPNNIYKYKYVVFHCAHYGIPRIRGNGSRPNQQYLPCGCGCMIRLAYNFEDQTLRVNSLVAQHKGHSRDRDFFEKVAAKISSGKSRRGSGNTYNSAQSTPVSTQGGVWTPPGTPQMGSGMDLSQVQTLQSLLTTQEQLMQLLQQAQSGISINKEIKREIITDL